MTENKHTPGPWMVGPSGKTIFGGEDELLLASCELTPFTPTTKRANARLIAVAPELLEALEEMVKMYEDVVDCSDLLEPDSEPTADAKAAIAKAKGEQ